MIYFKMLNFEKKNPHNMQSPLHNKSYAIEIDKREIQGNKSSELKRM